MNDRRRSRPTSTAIPIFRVISLMVMLAVIGLTIYNLNGRGNLAVVAPPDRQDKPPVNKAARPFPRTGSRSPTKTRSSGSSSAAIAKRSWTRRRSSTDMSSPRIAHVMGWIQSQSLADLRGRAFPEVPFQDFIQHPSKHRGRPVRVELLVRRVLSFEPEDAGKKENAGKKDDTRKKENKEKIRGRRSCTSFGVGRRRRTDGSTSSSRPNSRRASQKGRISTR